MRLTVDTNMIVRATMNDDATQSPLAQHLLETSDLMAIPTAAFCEFAWVLKSRYALSPSQIAQAIRRLTAGRNVRFESVAVNAGLAMLDGGGDFADGAIAAEGRILGGLVFASFDRAAVKRVVANGSAAFDPAAPS